MLVECPKRGDGQDWEESHLLDLLRKCDILIALIAARAAPASKRWTARCWCGRFAAFG